MMKGRRNPISNLYMLNLTQSNNLLTEFQTPDKYFAGDLYEWKSKGTLVDYHHASCWSPTQSGWIKAITKNFFTSCPGLSFELVQKYLTKNNQPYWGTLNNLGKSYDTRRRNNSNQNQIMRLNQDKTNFPHMHSENAPILSPSRQWIWQVKCTLTKQEGFQSHPARAKNIYWWHTTMTQTLFMRNI